MAYIDDDVERVAIESGSQMYDFKIRPRCVKLERATYTPFASGIVSKPGLCSPDKAVYRPSRSSARLHMSQQHRDDSSSSQLTPIHTTLNCLSEQQYQDQPQRYHHHDCRCETHRQDTLIPTFRQSRTLF